MIKLRIHSSASPITNSSTVIYTYQNSVSEAKDLVQEILNLSAPGQKAEDVFWFDTFTNEDVYHDFLSENREDVIDDDEQTREFFNLDWKDQGKWIRNYIEKVLKKEIEKPKWMKQAEESETYLGYVQDIELYLLEKDKKYAPLREKILNFLNSVDADGGRDG